MKEKRDDIEINENAKLNLDDDAKLEEIARIVEENIHIWGDDLLKYDGYDVPEEGIEYEEVVDYDNPKHEENNRVENAPSKRTKIRHTKENNQNNEIKRNNDTKKEKISRASRETRGFDFIKKRYTTLDVIMGVAVISLILSSGIGVVSELPDFVMFSKWNGITFGDLGLPLLLFSICFMIPTEIELDVKRKKSFKEIVIKKLKIGVTVFLIGIIINLIEAGNFNSFRIMGILQMIAIVYTVGSLIYIIFRRFNFKISVIAVFLTIIGLIGVVGYYFAASKFGDTAKTCLAYFVDSKVMPGHFGDFDRYSIVATISASFSGLLAIAGGSFLCNRRVENSDKCNRILIMGMMFVIIALVMERSCPYNASVLSPSFMMIILGGYFIVFSALFAVLDLNSNKIFRIISYPFAVMGSSAVFVIGLNELIRSSLFKVNVYSISKGCSMGLDEWLVVDMFSAILGNGSREIGLLIVYLLIIFALMLYLYSKKIFIRFK